MKKRLTKNVSALILTTLLSLTSIFVFGQTTLIDPNGSGGFEQGTDFAANGWTVVNTTTVNGSKWLNTSMPLMNGSYLFEPTGTNCAYVSNDALNWQYNSTANAAAASASHFYRDVTFPSGQTNINLSFRLNTNGEATYDELLVYLCPTTLTPAINSPSLTSASPTWTGTGVATLLRRTSVLTAGGGSTFNVAIPTSLVGNCSANSTMRLVFTWKNDGFDSYNPPAAIDDISLTSAAPTAITAAGGTFTINNTLATSGTNFASFTAAINALNLAGACALTGPIIFNVSAGQTFNEATPVITATGTATNTITFQKSGTGANPVIIPIGTSGSSDAGITLSGSDYITFDGIDVNASSINTVEFGYIIRNSSATNGAQNNTIKNCAITMNPAATTTSTSAGIAQSSSSSLAAGIAATSAAGANSGNKYYNLTISNALNGVSLAGTSGFRDLGTEVGTTACTIRNTFTNLGPTSLTFTSGRGIVVANQENIKLFNNDITNVTSNQATAFGISASTLFGANEIYNNKVSGVANIGSTTTTSIAYGMQIQLATAVVASAKIYNNSIANVYTSFTGTATATRRAIGLLVGVASATSTQVYEVDNNSISIGNGLTPTYSNACFEIQNTSAVYKVRNNVFANLTGAQGATARHSCWATTTTNIGATGSLSNYNDLFVLNDGGVSGFTGANSTTTYYATVANWTAAMTGTVGTDANSIAANPNFINSNTDLHSAALALNGAGTTAQTWVTADLDCATRTPDNDLGAYIINACSGTPTAGTIAGLTSLCSGTSTTLVLSGSTTAAGTSIQWASSTVSGGPYTNLGTSFSQATGSLTAQTFYVATATCSVSGLSASTAEFSVAINALPTVSVNQATGVVCLPGGSISLTASGAATYAWSPATGLSAATGASVTANPTTTTTYTVTGTGSNGCLNTTTSAITVATRPTLLPATATPSSVCSGASSQLSVVSTNTPANTYTFAASSGTFTPLTGGTAVTTGTTTPTAAAFLADEVISTVIPIGFSFPFGGANQTSLIASSNGYLIFNTAITSALANNALATSSNPVIAPLWDDLDGASGASPSASYTTTGTPGSRVFTIEWLRWQWNYNATGAQISFQVKLYEETGKIEMIYRPETGTINLPSASIGISSSAGNYLSLNGTGAAPTASSTTETTTLSTAPVNGQTYSFTPTIPTISWSPATFLSSTSIANPMATNVTATTTYTVTATSPSTCSSSGSVTLTAGSPLTSSTNASPNDTICSGLNLTLQALPVGGGSPYTYAWTGPASFTSTDQNPVINAITVANAGSYSVVISDNCGATTTSSINIVVNQSPTVAVNQATGVICLPGGSSIPLTASGAVTYAWSPSTGLSATTGASVTANPTTTTTYTVTGTGSNGCLNTTTSAITVAPNPTILPPTASPSNVCLGASSQLNVVSTNPAASAYTFAASSGTFTPLTGGTAVTTGTTTPTAAAFLADDVISTVIPIGFSFPFGGANQTSLIASSNGFLIFNTTSPSSSATNALATSSNPVIAPLWDDLDGASGASPSASYTTTGTAGSRVFTIEWLNWQWNYSATGAQISFQVKLYEATGKIEMIYRPETGTINSPSASIGISSSAGNYLSLNGTGTAPTASSTAENTALSTAPVSGQTYSFTPAISTTPTYSWSPATLLSSASIANPVVTNVTATATYTVTVTNPSTCSSSGSVTLIAGSLLTSSANVSPNDTVCSGLNLTLQALPVGGGSPYTYAWTGPASFTSTDQNPVINAIAVTNAGSYSVVITDNCGATSTSSINIVVNQSPTVTVTQASTLFCTPGTGIAINASGANTYAWSPAATLSAATGAAVVASPTTATTYSVIGKATNGCTDTATTSAIAVSPSVTMNTVTALPSSVCNGGGSALNANASLNSAVYCIPTYSSGTSSGDYISYVKLNTLSNTTAGSPTPYYTLYPAADSTTTTLTAGTQYTLTLKAGTYTLNDLAAWIDYDQDGVLGNVASEKLGEIGNLGATPASTTFTFTVPTTALNGKVRLRVREMDHSTTNDMTPCTVQSAYGEVEDYVITIVGGVNALSYSWSPSTALSATNTAAVSVTNATATTTYVATVTSAGGCTATGNATLVVKQPTSSTISPSACVSYTSPSGLVYTTSGQYTNTLTNSVGCDSVITINLTINPLPTINAGADVTVCAGSPVTLTATSNASTIAWNNNVTNATAFVPTATGPYIATATSADGCVKKDTVVITVNSLPFVSAGADYGVCTGQSTSLTGVSTLGGIPVSFAWNNSVANATPFVPTATTNYIVTGTDTNGCTNKDTVQVAVNSLPTVNAGADVTVCAGTTVILSGSGASTYVWNNSVTNGVGFAATATTTYTVTGTDVNGCVNTDSKVVNVNALPTVNAGADVNVCQFGQALLSGSGATSYVWNNGVSNNVSFIVTQTKTYTVTGTDANGCSKSDSVVVTMLDLPVVNAGNNISQCGNQSVTLSGTGAQVSWNNGIQNGVAFNAPFGTTAYILTGVNSFGCSNTDTVLVTINTIPTATAAITNTISLNASPAGATYQWINCATNTPIVGATSQLFTATANGSYSVIVTSAAGCADTSSCVAISKVGLDDLTGASARLYPNPTNGNVFVELNSIESVDALIYDAQGKLIETIKGLKNNSVIDLKAVETGVYMIHLNSSTGSMVQRIVKN